MKNLFFFTICTIVAISISGCHKLSAVQDTPNNAPSVSLQKQINAFNDKNWSPEKLSALASMKTAYESRLDTNKMNPRTTEASIAFKLKYNATDKQETANQLAFIKSSGFPVIASPQYAAELRKTVPNSFGTTGITDLFLASMKEDFNTADARYKAFVLSNSKNQYISVFKQDAANLIIRKYLLNGSDTDALKFYVDELIHNGSRDYPLIYLSLNQLRYDLPKATLNGYQSFIMHDKDGIRYRQILDFQRKEFINTANNYGGKLGDVLRVQALMLQLPLVRAGYFMNKINAIGKTVEM